MQIFRRVISYFCFYLNNTYIGSKIHAVCYVKSKVRIRITFYWKSSFYSDPFYDEYYIKCFLEMYFAYIILAAFLCIKCEVIILEAKEKSLKLRLCFTLVQTWMQDTLHYQQRRNVINDLTQFSRAFYILECVQSEAAGTTF